jgi:hypothetical protein
MILKTLDMLIYINGFWPGFSERTDGVHWGFFEYILERVLDCKIIPCSSIDSADILLESYFNTSVFGAKSWKYSIFFSGEAHELPPNAYTFCMGARDSGPNFISCPLYLAYDYCRPFSYPTKISEVPTKSMCSIISSGIGNERCNLLSLLAEKGIKIDNAGRYNNTIGYSIPGSYSDPPILDFQNRYRLVMAFENAQLDDYITEKILNPFRAGTIPVYFGSKQISNYFNPKRFIEVTSIEDTVSKIQTLLSNDSLWLDMVNEPIFIRSTAEIIDSIIEKMKKYENICSRSNM